MTYEERIAAAQAKMDELKAKMAEASEKSKAARALKKEEIGQTIDELYSEFRDKPLGSASVGQAHYAVLKDGTAVVTKVQRPLIADMMKKDYAMLKKLAKLVNVVMDEDEDEQTIDLYSVIEELEKVTDEELDFRVEARNTKFFKENCIPDEEKITCPTVIDELTTSRIFTMTLVDGYTVSHKDRIIEDGYDVLWRSDTASPRTSSIRYLTSAASMQTLIRATSW